EANETVKLTLGTVTPLGTGVSATNIVGSGANDTTTIINDDTATLTITANAPTTTEGNGTSTHTVTYTVKSDKAVQGGFTVAFSDSGTATAGTDYTVDTPSPLTFTGNANETQDITVTIKGDDVVEANETVKLTLGTVTPLGTGVSATNIVGSGAND